MNVESNLVEASDTLNNIYGKNISITEWNNSISNNKINRKRRMCDIEEENDKAMFLEVVRNWDTHGLYRIFETLNNQNFMLKCSINQNYIDMNIILNTIIQYREVMKKANELYDTGDTFSCCELLNHHAFKVLFEGKPFIEYFNMSYLLPTDDS